MTKPESGPPEPHIHQPLQPHLAAVLSPLEKFLNLQSAGGVVLFGATALALACRNSPLESWYLAVQSTPLGFNWGSLALQMSLREFVNDGLMALLFLLLGLELKRELLVGQLRDRNKLMPVSAAAVGGMLLPAIIFLAINRGTDNLAGWGIPIATDVAFALGLLMLFGDRMPSGLRVFLVSFALFDDLGAILVIAVFYSSGSIADGLVPIVLSVGAVALLNLTGINRPLPYLVAGVVLWYWLHHGGIHGTLAGVIVGLAAPASPKLKPRQFGRIVRERMRRFGSSPASQAHDHMLFEDPEKHDWAAAVGEAARQATSPVRRWEAALDMPVFFLIVPAFAFVNAGVEISGAAIAAVLSSPLGLGIVAGLFGGKLTGVAGAVWLASRAPSQSLFDGARAVHLPLLGALAGIGFTMSMLIANLAFIDRPEKAELAITAVLTASLMASALAASLAALCRRR